MSTEDTRPDLVQLDMQHPGYEGPVLLAEVTGEIVYLHAGWWTEVDGLPADPDAGYDEPLRPVRNLRVAEGLL